MKGTNFKSFLKAIITLSALTMNYNLIDDEVSSLGYENPESALSTLSKLFYSIEAPTIMAFLLVIFLTVFYAYVSRAEKQPKRTMAGVHVMAAFAAFWTITGKLFYVYKDIGLITRGTVQCIKGMFAFAGFFLLFSGLIQMAVIIYINCCNKSADTNANKLFDKKYAAVVIAALILMIWLPTIVAYYPAVFMGDSEDVIYMAYNHPTKVGSSVVPIKEGIYITNHHPAVYTGYVSLFLHVVRALGGSYNLGIFLCAITQGLLTLCILTYSCMYCAKKLHNGKLAFAAALFYALFPLIPRYAIMISKDTFFADFLFLWAILLHKTIHTENTKKDIMALAVTSVGVVLIRKNGVYVIILTLVFAAVLYQHFWKRWIFVLATIVVVNAVYSNIVLPVAGIPDGSVREMLSVPFQQTARFVKYHADEVTQEERQAIERVLAYDELADAYGGNLSDPVKRTFNKNATGDDLKAYFGAWFQMLLKHPETYAAAFLNNYYGYFYFVVNDITKLARTSVGSMANVNRDGYFDFSHCYDAVHTGLRDILTWNDVLWMRVPVLNILMTSAFYVWAVLAAFFLKWLRRDKAAVLTAFMYLALILTVLVGPSNAINYERYIFPCILAIPFLVTLTFSEEERSVNNV